MHLQTYPDRSYFIPRSLTLRPVPGSVNIYLQAVTRYVAGGSWVLVLATTDKAKFLVTFMLATREFPPAAVSRQRAVTSSGDADQHFPIDGEIPRTVGVSPQTTKFPCENECRVKNALPHLLYVPPRKQPP